MSKTLKRYKRMFIASGNNTSFYKDKRRNIRRTIKRYVRSILGLKDLDDVEIQQKQYKDDWFEPTDGSWLMTKHNADERWARIDKQTKKFKQ